MLNTGGRIFGLYEKEVKEEIKVSIELTTNYNDDESIEEDSCG